jgi:hypothetical protein
MTLVTLAEELRTAAEREGSIRIDAEALEDASLVPPAGLDALITRSLKVPRLVLATTAAQIGTPTDTELTVSGSFDALGVTGLRATIVFQALGTAVSFVLDAPLPGDWTFTTSFPRLAGFPFDDVETDGSTYLFSTGKVASYRWGDEAIALAEGLNFAGFATIGEALAPLLMLVPGARQKPVLSGPIEPTVTISPVARPDLELAAGLFEGPLPPLGFLELTDAELGVEVTTEAIVEGQEQYAAAFLLAKLGATGSEIELDCRIEVSANLSNLRMVVGPPASKAITIEDIFALMGGRTWYSTIPGPLQALFSSVGFKGMEASISTNGGTPQLQAIGVTVGSTSPWPLWDEWRIDTVDFSWLIAEPLGKAPRVSGTFGGAAHFFPSVFTGIFYASISTDLFIAASYQGDVKLSKVLEELAPGTVLPDHMEVELRDFGVSIDKPRSAFSIAATAAASMDVLGNGSLTMGELQLLSASPSAAPRPGRSGTNGGSTPSTSPG